MKVLLVEETDLTNGSPKEVDFFGRPVVVFRQDGQVKAYINACTHVGGPLKLSGETLECQWHGACFEAATGRATKGPASLQSRLIRLPTCVEEGKVFYVYRNPRLLQA